jgi:Tfp pilus assembly protein PilN
MIKINLTVGKKAVSLTKVAGFDLSLVNVKMMIIAFIVMYVPEPMLRDMWNEELAKAQQEIQTLTTKKNEIATQVDKAKNIKLQLDAFKEQEEKLSKKITQVKEVINKKQNPYNVLLYLAKNINNEVWIDQMDLKERTLVIKGKAKQWQDIGNFIQILKDSIYFDKNSVNFTSPQKAPNDRFESFDITAQIVRFE